MTREPNLAQVVALMSPLERRIYSQSLEIFITYGSREHKIYADEIYAAALERYNSLPWYRRIFR